MAESGSSDEVARLRAAVQTLADMVIGHGIMDARTLQALLGDIVEPVLRPIPVGAPVPVAVTLPPPAPSAAELAAPAGRPTGTQPMPAARPVTMAAPTAPRPATMAPPTAAPRPATMAPPTAAPRPATVAPPTAVPRPASIAAPLAAPSPIADSDDDDAMDEAPTPAPQPRAARPASITVAAVLDEPAPVLKSPGLFARLFGKRNPAASPAAVAKTAASIEFTERMPKLPFGDKDGLYSEQQRATELSFPPPSTVRKARPAAKKARAAAAATPARGVCDRCWRRLDADGNCKSCG